MVDSCHITGGMVRVRSIRTACRNGSALSKVFASDGPGQESRRSGVILVDELGGLGPR